MDYHGLRENSLHLRFGKLFLGEHRTIKSDSFTRDSRCLPWMFCMANKDNLRRFYPCLEIWIDLNRECFMIMQLSSIDMFQRRDSLIPYDIFWTLHEFYQASAIPSKEKPLNLQQGHIYFIGVWGQIDAPYPQLLISQAMFAFNCILLEVCNSEDDTPNPPIGRFTE